MKTALAVMVIALACLLAADCSAQSMSSRQSLSGDSGRSILASLNANDTQLNETNETAENTSLWSWGSAPRGSILVDGKLLTDPFNTWKAFNATGSGMVPVGVDPYRGYPVYAYQDPVTGNIQYYYLDPYTGVPFYLDGYGGVDTTGTATAVTGSYTLPQVFG